MYSIMIIDDDESIGNMEQELLEREEYQVQRAFSGTEALLLLKQKRPDLILLDLMLPGMSGEKVLSQIQGIPIIVVGAKTDAGSKVNLLLGGAVDYLTKPFDTKELLARINIRLRESMRTTQFPIYNYGELNIDETSRKVSLEDKTVNLTRTEFAILKLLVQNPGQVIAKSVLLDRISLDTPDCTENSLKTHISHLRGKLREISGKEYVESVWGIGFRWKLGYPYFDVDDYIWKQNTDSPNTQMYTRDEKISRLSNDIAPYEHCVMAGSMSSFHYAFDEMFEMIVFLYVSPDIRIERVHKRAIERFGKRVLEGGDMYEAHMRFLNDNRSYEGDGSPNMREQKEWMKNMSCVKIELDGAADLEKNADLIVNNWNGIVR